MAPISILDCFQICVFGGSFQGVFCGNHRVELDLRLLLDVMVVETVNATEASLYLQQSIFAVSPLSLPTAYFRLK